MDTFAHALWTGIAFQRAKQVLWATFFGVAPDLFSFGLFFMQMIITGQLFFRNFDRTELPDPSFVPQYVHSLYSVTHSLVIFLIVFGIVWAIRKKPFWELGGWALHILIDIPTHTSRFFPTPFPFPFSSFTVNGMSWGTPWFMIVNYISLITLYVFIFFRRRHKRM